MAEKEGRVIWFTGLSGSGKSTLASSLSNSLEKQGIPVYTLDGDQLRSGLNSDLGFSAADRSENIRRAAEVAKLFSDKGFCVLATFISPFGSDRAKARQIIGNQKFKELYVQCPLTVCEARDVKGLYRKARAGQIAQFTGIDSPYEAPLAPDLVVSTSGHSIDECTDQILKQLF